MTIFNSTVDADTLTGGAGNDLFIIPTAEFAIGDLITGGGGTDEIRFTSAAADGETLFIDPDSDIGLVVIGTGTGVTALTTGTAPHDIVASGMSTAVMLVGNAGANMLIGGDANDTLQGNAGADMLLGGDGNDQLVGGAGADFADGEDGDDTYVISVAADFTVLDSIADSGVPGDKDTIEIRTASGIVAIGVNVSGIEAITIVGATATSAAGVTVAAAVTQGYLITGNAAANAVTGGSGADTIVGAGGGDSMTGGAGNDLFLVRTAAEAVGDKYVGGAGNDFVEFSPTTLQVGAAATLVVGATAGSGIEGYAIGGSDAYNISVAAFGAAAGTTLIGNSNNNVLTGGAGADTFVGGGGNDSLVGGSGADVVSYLGDYSGVTANLTNNTGSAESAGSDSFSGIEGLIGTFYGDSLTGNALANRIDGSYGADTIVGGAGADTLVGGQGADVFLVSAGKHGSTDLVDGGDDTDEMRFTSTVAGDTLTIGRNVTNVEHIGITNDAGSSDGTTALNINAAAASYGMLLNGNSGANVITGSNFADFIQGDAGNDRLDGRGGNDTMGGNTGDDRVDGGAGWDSLTGGDGNDLLFGGSGGDSLVGGLGNDTIYGGAGDDDYFVDGGDLFVELPGGGYDIVGTSGSISLNAGNSIEKVLVVPDELGLPAEIDINASALSTSIVLDGRILGTFPTATKGMLSGGAGDDTLQGSNGADTLIGGAGNDSLNGGNGTDLADYSAATGALTIDLNLGGASGIGVGTDILALIENVTGGSGNDFLTGNFSNNALSGGGGADTINGGGGSDNLTGGAGNDIFVFDQTPVGAITTVADFASITDDFKLSDAAYTGVLAASTAGVLNAAAFHSAADISSGSAGQYILYNTGTGALYYDANADGDGTDAVQFATLTGAPAVANTDFHIVS